MTDLGKRVFLGSIATETNTFSPLRTDLQDFKDSFYAPPGQHPVTPTLCSAIYPVARSRAAQFGWQLVEGTATWAERHWVRRSALAVGFGRNPNTTNTNADASAIVT